MTQVLQEMVLEICDHLGNELNKSINRFLGVGAPLRYPENLVTKDNLETQKEMYKRLHNRKKVRTQQNLETDK